MNNVNEGHPLKLDEQKSIHISTICAKSTSILHKTEIWTERYKITKILKGNIGRILQYLNSIYMALGQIFHIGQTNAGMLHNM